MASPIQAIHLPSGLQTALRSLEPGVRLMLRVTPASTGTSKTSPRAVTAIRAPSGDRLMPVRLPATALRSVRPYTSSEASVTVIFVAWRVFGSSRYSQPPFSKTMVLPSVEGNFTSYSLKSVTFSVFFVFVLYTKRFMIMSRSEAKKISSPIHIGKMSWATFSVMFSTLPALGS